MLAVGVLIGAEDATPKDLAEAFEELDDWLRKGGALPREWQR
jgi:hypothetical protein